MHLSNPKVAYHRNGVSGEGFHVVTFDYKDRPRAKRRRMMAIVFGYDRCCVAVVDLDMAANDQIAFGENSWRGDDFEGWLRKQITTQPDAFIDRHQFIGADA